MKKLLKREVYNLSDAAINITNYFIGVENIFSIFDKTKDIINNFLHPKECYIFLFTTPNKDAPIQLIEEAKKLNPLNKSIFYQ